MKNALIRKIIKVLIRKQKSKESIKMKSVNDYNVMRKIIIKRIKERKS